jgi:phage tail-like protein
LNELGTVNFFKLALINNYTQGFEADEKLNLRLDPSKNGCLITSAFDAFKFSGTYNRLVLEGDFSSVKLEVIIAASNRKEFVINGESIDIDDYIHDGTVPFAEKGKALAAIEGSIRIVNETDILLHSIDGRFVWIYVAAYPVDEHGCVFNGMRLELPRVSFLKYFPEIYQDNEFLDSYISIFQSMFLDRERLVDNLPRLLNYHTAPDENIRILADWLGLDTKLYTSDMLRVIIEKLDLFQGGKGTKLALEEIIKLSSGYKAKIIEHFRWRSLKLSADQSEQNERLYGGIGGRFCIIVYDTQETPSQADKDRLRAIADDYTPLGTGFNIVWLKPSSNLDTHCYLDINSLISVPEVAGLGDDALGGYLTIA